MTLLSKFQASSSSLSKTSCSNNDISESIMRKILGHDWSFGYNCYEVGHTWTPNCTEAALEIATTASLKVMPLYAALYTFSQLAVQRKYDLPSTLDSLESTLRSSAFIFFHAYNGSAMACLLRWSFGRFYYRVLICIPALISCYLSLLIEKPARRQALAFYMLNMASEIIYRMLVSKGYFNPIKNGETLLFALSLAAWSHLIKQHGFGRDPVSAIVKLILGREESKNNHRQNDIENEKFIQFETNSQTPLKTDIQQISEISLVEWIKDLLTTKHSSCPHNESSCFEYITSKLLSRFGLGYGIQVGLRLATRPLQLYLEPGRTLLDAFANKSAIRMGLFVATLVGSGRLVNCFLRHYSNSNSVVWHAPVAGFISGLSMLWSPKSSLSMYIMWKAVEQYYLQAARSGKVQYVDFTIMSIYAASASILLYSFALEPRFIRPSYMKFLDTISDHRLHQLNRLVLDVFGTGSSIGYEGYFPDLHPKLMSNEFKELIFNWLIQPF